MRVHMDVKDSLARQPAVINGLHRPCEGIAADSGADSLIIYILDGEEPSWTGRPHPNRAFEAY
jgi:hypothetical protein